MKKYMFSMFAIAATCLVGCSNINNYESRIYSFIADQNLAPMESIDSVLGYELIVLSDQHLALTIQNGKSYFLTMPDDCHNIFWAKKVILLAEDKGVIKVDSDKIVRVGDKYTECTITGIYKLYSVQLQQLAGLSRRKHPMRSHSFLTPLSSTESKSIGFEH
ncbi:MAG: hypothetical protein ACI8UG_001023 [Gammaproteobacteria bacterium]|jgi:hypothetical protein